MKDSCHICGQDAVSEGLVEGARVALCGNCIGLGKPIASNRQNDSNRKIAIGSRNNQTILNPVHAGSQGNLPIHHDIIAVANYGKVLQTGREGAHMTRKELGEKLFISENVIERIEHEYLKPDLKTAQKLEQFLKIKIVQEDTPGKVDEGKKELEAMRKQTKASGNLTAGDVIQIKMKKN